MIPLPPEGLRIDRYELRENIAAFSLDLETDFGTGRTEALARLGEFVDLLAALDVPWTAFAEGHFFETRRDILTGLQQRGVDLQLHCYDHSQPGDTADSLARSAAVYSGFAGHRPEGYRAHTYRLTRPLFDALVCEGFLWDSSLMCAFAQGRNPHAAFRGSDYLVLDGRLVEFPLGTWRGVPLAFNHTHVLLAKTPGEAVLRTLFGPPRLAVYNFHLTDLVRCDSLRAAKRTATVKALYRYLWSTHGGDTFSVVRRVVRDLRRRGYTFVTMSDLYRRVLPTIVRAFQPD
jgi:hypothetical protein